MFRLLVNGKVPNRGDETEIRTQLKSLYKDQLLEVALQYRFIANGLKNELDKLKQQNLKWQELKEWLDEKQNNFKMISKHLGKTDYTLLANCVENILLKMQELEAKNEN